MKYLKKKKVLFLSTGNSVRSLMAEALLKQKAGEYYDVFSAGTQPEVLEPKTLAVLKKFDLQTAHLLPKHVTTFVDQVFDYVITLCDSSNSECRSYPNALKQLAWDIPDPRQRIGHDPFVVTLCELNDRLSMFLSVEGQTKTASEKEINILTDFDPLSFYKALTDDIRLKTLMLSYYHGELCVCELMQAMKEDSQPKVSRHLAVLKKAKVIVDRKHGQWVFYRINPALPLWAKAVIAQTTEHNIALIEHELQRLTTMQNRPDRASFCK